MVRAITIYIGNIILKLGLFTFNSVDKVLGAKYVLSGDTFYPETGLDLYLIFINLTITSFIVLGFIFIIMFLIAKIYKIIKQKLKCVKRWY